MNHILEAARLAPSPATSSRGDSLVVRDAEARRRIVEDGFLPGIKMDWALEAPVHVVIGMETSFLTHRLAASVSGVDYPWVDIWHRRRTPGAGGNPNWGSARAGLAGFGRGGGGDRRLAQVHQTRGGYHGWLLARVTGRPTAMPPAESRLKLW